MTRDELINKARSYMKPTAYPNPNEFTRWFWKDNLVHAWCGAFIDFVVKQDLGCNWLDSCTKEKYVGGFGYVPSIVQWAKDNGYWSNKGKKGDLVVFDWSPETKGDYWHIGIVVDVNDYNVISVDGNTSQGNDKENCVAEKARELKYVAGYVNLPYDESGKAFNIGDKVVINGGLYPDAYASKPTGHTSERVTNITRYVAGAKHPYNTTGDLGWMNTSDIKPYEEPVTDYKELYEKELLINKNLKLQNDKLQEMVDELEKRIYGAIEILSK